LKIKNGKDFWAGVMFIAFGIGFMVAARQYAMGTSVRMGPSYFPTVLGAMLTVLGAVVFFRAFVSKVHHSIDVFPFRWIMAVAGSALALVMYMSAGWWAGLGKTIGLVQYGLNGAALLLIIAAFGPRPLFMISLGTVLFGYMLKPLGLVIATALLIIISAWGGHEFKLREVLIMFAVLAVFSVVTFIYGLGLPINIWPELG
jgi:hypothetical protein